MYSTISKSEFRDAFKDYNRDNFSYEGLGVLYDYLEDLYVDGGEDYELDVVALCSEFTESTIVEALKAYGYSSLDDLENNTLVIPVDENTIIFQSF